MLTFLRKIRKSLIDSGNARRYFLYAIGEIALVVIGILIALQINNWNEWRKDRVREKETLISLAQNLELNIRSIKTHIDDLRLHHKSSKIIISVLDNNLPYHDSLDQHFHLARVSKSNLHISQAGYEQYKQTGFNIIQNKVLKDEVINFFESTYPEFYGNYLQVNVQYVPFLDHHVPLFIYKKDELKPIDFQGLFDDQYYIGWIRAYMEGRITLIAIETDFLNEVKRVLQLLKEGIGERE